MNPSMLVVDDESVTRRLVIHALRTMPVDVKGAENGTEALRIAQEQELVLAIIDINLPDIDGFELMRRLKAIQPTLPMITFTARNHPGDEVAAQEAGAVDFLYKPFSTQELRELVTKHVRLS